MSRIKPADFAEETPLDLTLDELIPIYAQNKNELDSYKKICDEENLQIKNLMQDLGQDTYTAGEYTAKRTEVLREQINEDKLIAVLKSHKIPGVVKIREYVDMDALEAYLYDHELTPELATDMASCKTQTTVVQLRVTKKKAKKKEDE